MLKNELTAALQGHALPEGFASLRRLAIQAIARTPQSGDAAAVDDLVAAFLSDLAHGKGVTPLLNGDEAALEAGTRRRLRELAAEAGPQWLLVKALRQHVGDALDNLPPAPAAAPLDLTEAGQLSSARIAEACAWLLAQPERPARERKALAAALLTRYFGGQVLGAGLSMRGDEDDRPDELVRRQHDAYRIADRLVTYLGPSLSSVLMRHLAGHTLTEIAKADGCAISTVHARLAQAREKVVPIVRRSASTRTAGLALGVLAARAARMVEWEEG